MNKKIEKIRKMRLWVLPVPAVIVLAVVVFGGVGVVGALNGWFGGGSSIPEDTMTRGLVGSWGFDEGSGTTVYDGSGNNKNASSTACASGHTDNGNGTCTVTFYPNAHTESTSVDGQVGDQVDGLTWVQKHDATSGNFVSDAAASQLLKLQAGATAGLWSGLLRLFFLFDTSGLPDNAINISAVLSLYGLSKADAGNWSPSINIYSSNPASNTALVGDDYDQVETTAFATAISYNNFSVTGYNNFTLDASGIAAISLTGVSKFSARLSPDALNSEPAWVGGYNSVYFQVYMSEQGAGYQPKLVVTYAGGSPTWTTGKKGGALEFLGTSDYVSAGSVYNGVKSVEFWIKADNTTKKIMDLSNDQYVEVSNAAITATGWTSPTIYVNGVKNATTIATSTWAHVVITSDTGINATSTEFGRANSSYFDGTLDEVKFYSRVFSDAEVRYHYNRGGPVAEWKFDEGSGTKAYDSTDNKKNGTILHPALKFEEVNDYVSVPEITLGSTFTISAWFKSSDDYGGIISNAEFGDGCADISVGWQFGFATYPSAGNAGKVGFTGYDGGTICGSAYSLHASKTSNDNAWHHAAVTGNGTYWQLYLDGVADNGTAQTFNLPEVGQTIKIGYHSSGTISSSWNTYFAGLIDEVRIYNRALSAGEIAELYRGTASNNTGLVLNIPFSDASGVTATDYSGQGNNGTLTSFNSTVAGAGDSGVDGWTSPGPDWVSGKYGTALAFDGVKDNIPAGSVYDGVQTVSFWMKADNLTKKIIDLNGIANIEVISGVITANNFTSPTIYIDGAVKSSPTIDTNWHYVTITTNTGINASSTYIGSVGTGYFAGNLDDIRFYSYARTPDEIRLDYNGGFAAHFGPNSSCDDDPGACMTNGLVGYWDMEEGTGTAIHDRSGNSNNGITTNMTTPWASGVVPLSSGKKGGSALSFDGTNDYVDIGSGSSLQISGDLTMEAWIKTIYPHPSYADFVGHYVAAAKGRNYEFGMANGKFYFLYANGVTSKEIFGNQSLNDGTWKHMMVVVDGLNYYFYVNGVQDKTGTLDFNITALPGGRSIGGLQAWSGQFNGTIDEARIYNRALSAEEVRYHYNQGGPVAEWKMDEGTGRTVYDSTNNNNDGTLVLAGSATSSAWVAGKYGTALSFDGVDDYVQIPNNTLLNFGDGASFSIDQWVKTTQTGFGITTGKINWTSMSSAGYMAGLNNGYARIELQDGTGNYFGRYASERPVNDGNWHHVVFIRDGDTDIYIYIDGVRVKTTSAGISLSALGSSSNTQNTTIGMYLVYSVPTYLFNGLIDDVRIYNYARTPAQIQLDYNAGLAAHFGPSAGSGQAQCNDDPGACMTEGLMGYWNMEEGSGLLAHDTSGYSNSGTLTSGPLWASGIIPGSSGKKGGGALQFDGSDDYVNTGSGASLNMGTGSFTIESWIRFASPYVGAIAAKGYAPGAIYGLEFGSADRLSLLTRESAANTIDYQKTNAGLDDGSWHHIVGVLDSSQARGSGHNLYVDGVWLSGSYVVNTGSGTINTDSANPLLIGYDQGYGGYFNNGLIDEVRVYNRALSAEEVRYHYNRGGPIAQWKMDEGEGRTVYDSTPNNNDGTLVLAGSATSSAWVQGKFGSALSFDGVDDYVGVPNSSSLEMGTKDFTLEAWFKIPSTPAAWQYIISKGHDQGGSGAFKSYYLDMYSNGLIYAGLEDNAGHEATVTAPYTVGVWQHVVVVADRDSSLSIYVDGVLKNTLSSITAVGNIDTSTVLGIGSYYNYAYAFFNGLLDDVRIYNYARTQAQIQQDYNAGVGTHFK